MINPLTLQVFYIGKGTHAPKRSKRWSVHLTEARRWNEGCGWGNTLKLRTIKKIFDAGMVPICEIIGEYDTENDAYKEEHKQIKKYGRLFNDTGILTNLMEFGSTSFIYSKEKRKNLRERLSGKGNPMYGKHHTKQTRELISETRKQRLKSGEIVPTKHTTEWKKHLRENNAGGKATAKKVIQIDPKTGNVIKIWDSTRRAGKSLNIITWRNISACCNVHKNRVCGGFYWRWENDEEVVNGKLENINMMNMKRKGKPVNQIKNNNIVKTWSTMSEIAKHYSVVASAITVAVKSGCEFRGYYWEYI